VIVLEVIGTPQPQGNKSAFVRGGRAVLVEGRRGPARANFKSWREAVAQAGRDWQAEHQEPLLDVPVAIGMAFRLPRPKSSPKRRLFPDGRPDLDKCVRAVFDALTGVLISNDSRVVSMWADKTFAVDVPPGVTITITKASA
jgi:crossover junction endodeoxyribonuclease RusA